TLAKLTVGMPSPWANERTWKPEPRFRVSNGVVSLSRNFLVSLVAVLLGNAIYFLAMPHLPVAAQHRSYNLFPDLGLVIDFWICLVIYGIILLLFRPGAQRRRSSEQRH